MEEHTKLRLEKLEKIKELGHNPYPYSFEKTHSFEEIKKIAGNLTKEELSEKKIIVRTAGRIISNRKMGKSSFMHIFDGNEQMQIYIKRDGIEEKYFQLYKLLDISDYIGVEGEIFVTRTGEISIYASKLYFIVKSLHPLPEKWHGLQDKEIRYRQRALDLIVNEESRKTFKQRSQIIREIRMFFYENGYDEVETPMTQPIAGGASAKPFVTHHNALNIDLFLRIAPELYLKRLLVGGMEKVFELNRNFRNEGIDLNHNPEFTMIEWYCILNDFTYNMDLTEKLFERLNQKFTQNNKITWQDKEIDLTPPFKKAKFMDLIAEKTNLSLDNLWDEDFVKEYIKEKHKEEKCPPTFGKMLDLLFSLYVEEDLLQPIFVTHHPKSLSPLAKEARDDKRETERFELFIGGMELANGYSELNDPIDQKERFLSQLKDKEKGDDEAQELDMAFVRALEQGMPPATGEGIGIDRLIMLYTGASSIKEVILFPALRPKK